MQSVEKTILKTLLQSEEYARKTIPFIKTEYFKEEEDRILFDETKNFILKYNVLPSYEALYIEIDALRGLKQTQVDNIKTNLRAFFDDKEKSDQTWLLRTTEKFCQDAAIYHAIVNSMEIINGQSKQTTGAIPGLLQDALSVSFDPHVGHEYFDEFEKRYDYYHRVESRIPFDLKYFNLITNNGVPKKTLNVLLGTTGIGKTLCLCHLTKSFIEQGKNVLYITMEMSQEEIGKRIDANILNLTIDDLLLLPHDTYKKRMSSISAKTNGKLIIKEYPTATASVSHFRALLNELNLKKSFVPDVIVVDYLNICMSSRLKMGNSVNSYLYIKSIAEELRGLAVEYDVPIWSATQGNRSAQGNSDIGLENTSESWGLPSTVDFMVALIMTEELEEMGQMMVKQLKNRYGDPSKYKRFIIGIDRAKMKLYDVEQSAQTLNDAGHPEELKEKKDKFKRLKV